MSVNEPVGARPDRGGWSPFPDGTNLEQLEARAASGWGISLMAKVGVQAVQILSLLILARLLTPADFGVNAMVMSVVGIAGVLRDFGLSTATVRHPSITRGQINTLFWLNLGLGAVMTIIVAACAPLVEGFYSDPRIATVTVVLAFTFVLNGLNTQHMALLRREMHFASIARIGLSSAIIGNSAAIALAWAGAGYWALVASSIASGLSSVLVSWRLNPWRPGLPRFDPDVIPMLQFGGYLFLFTVLAYVAMNLPTVIAGWLGGASSAGLFDRAFVVLALLLGYVLEPLGMVVPTALARLQNNPADFRLYYLRSVAHATVIAAPVCVVCVTFADDIVATLLGAQWSEAARFLRLLGVSALAQVLCNTAGWLNLARGYSHRMLQWGIFGWTFIIISLLCGSRFGLEGIAAAYSASIVLLTWPCLVWNVRGTQIRVVEILAAIWRPAAAAVIVTVPAAASHALASPLPAPLRLAVALLVYAGFFLLLLGVMGQRALLVELAAQLLPRMKAKSKT